MRPKPAPPTSKRSNWIPKAAPCYVQLGTCLRSLGDWHGALACFQRAARLDPRLAEAEYFSGLMRLGLGNFKNGWQQFEARRRCPQLVRRQYSLPMWNGREIAGGQLLIHAEHDWADTLQFIRFVAIAIQRGGVVTLDIPERLMPLLAQSGYPNLISSPEPPPECQGQTPLLSLPRILGTSLETIPAKVPYLSAKPELVAHWRDRLNQTRGFRIGIAWQGDTADALDRWRWIPPAAFAPLAGLDGVRLIQLPQKAGLEQIAADAPGFEIVRLGDDLDTTAGALMDTAAIIANFDLVVTADMAVAHLAGALGAKVWLALSTACDWRWMQTRTDSPWYPTMRLFRQTTLGDWAGVFASMAGELPALIAQRSTRVG